MEESWPNKKILQSPTAKKFFSKYNNDVLEVAILRSLMNSGASVVTLAPMGDCLPCRIDVSNIPQINKRRRSSMDKIVITARQLLGDAIQALDKGDSYNTKHPYEASFPNGAADHIRMIMECIIRLDATRESDKAADCLGYIALYCGWVIAGCPRSEFAWISNRYMNLFKIQESKLEEIMEASE